MKWTIKAKTFLSLFATGIISIFVIGFLGFQTGKKGLREQTFNQLTSLRENDAARIEEYFQQIRAQVETFADNHMIVDAVQELKQGFHAIPEELDLDQATIDAQQQSVEAYYRNQFLPTLNKSRKKPEELSQVLPSNPRSTILQALYLANNPHPLGSKDQLQGAKDNSSYSKAHARFHPTIRSYLKKFGYYDIFLMDPDTQHIVYSVFKETDFAMPLTSGPLKTSNITAVFWEIVSKNTRGFVKMVDFAPYGPSYGAPASFIGTGIFDNNRMVGVLVFQVPIQEINRIMTHNRSWEKVGLGKTGEAYLVAHDLSMRSDSRFLLEDKPGYLKTLKETNSANSEVLSRIDITNSSILQQQIDTQATRSAIKKESGTSIIKDYRDIPVLSAYAPLNIPDMSWAIMAEIDTAEAFASIDQLAQQILLSGAIILLLVTLSAWAMARTLTIPIINLENVVKDLSEGEGDLTQRLPIQRMDELGQLATRFNQFLEKLHAIIKDVTFDAEAVNNSASKLESLAGNMASQVSGLNSLADETADLTQKLQTEMASVAQTSETSTSSAQSIAISSEEMTATIQEISGNAGDAKHRSDETVENFTKASASVNQLAEAILAIDSVTNLIVEIAEKTKLLALNANIEAARAGEAGKGFAVVAGEVKDLAKQTNDATDEIREKIGTMQNLSDGMIEAITTIDSAFQFVNELISANASAVEEQSVTTKDIAQNISQVARGLQEMRSMVKNTANFSHTISSNMQVVRNSSNQLDNGSSNLNHAAHDLARLGQTLETLVKRFRV